jgi:hypothetical protein
MMRREQREETPHVVYAVPPNVVPRFWDDVQSKWINVRFREIEFVRERTKALVEVLRSKLLERLGGELRKM